MLKQNSLKNYFLKRKETDNNNSSVKKQCVTNGNIVTKLDIVSSQCDYSIYEYWI